MGMLAITFRGPFAFEITKHKVNVYAPKCDKHNAAIYTTNSEYPLCGRSRDGGDYVYQIVWSGIEKAHKQIEYPPVDSDLIWDPPPGLKIDTSYPLPVGGGDMILDAPKGSKI